MKGGPEGERMGWSERSGVSGGVMRGQEWKSVEKGGEGRVQWRGGREWEFGGRNRVRSKRNCREQWWWNEGGYDGLTDWSYGRRELN